MNNSERLLRQHLQSNYKQEAIKTVSRAMNRQVTLADLQILSLEGKQLVPLVSSLNAPQREFFAVVGIDPYSMIPPDISKSQLRLRILKARRFGISTVVAALYFCDTYNNNLRNTVVAAHTEDASKEIFQLYKVFYDNLPENKKIRTGRSNPTELFWPISGSRISIATAGGSDVKSGATIHNLHESEVAKWQGDIKGIIASLNTAAMYGNIIQETTAKGLNHFYKLWQECEEPDALYQGLFIPWYKDSRYNAEPPENFQRTEEEEKRAAAYNLTDSQLYWYRRAAIETKELTAQEFPDTAQDAFISSGSPYFDNEALNIWFHKLASSEYSPITDLLFDEDITPRLHREYRNSSLRIWESPEYRRHYIIGADPSQGIDDGNDHDFSSAHVLCVETGEIVATMHGYWTPEEFGRVLNELGRVYNLALLVVLSNNHGWGVLTQLRSMETRYPDARGNTSMHGVYYYDPSTVFQRSRKTNTEGRHAGYPENTASKPYMLDMARKMINDGTIICYDRPTISEMMTFVEKPGGSAGAEQGAHDDRVSSLAVSAAVWMIRKCVLATGDNIRDEEESDDFDDRPRTSWGK